MSCDPENERSQNAMQKKRKRKWEPQALFRTVAVFRCADRFFLSAFVLIQIHNRVHWISDRALLRPDRLHVFGVAKEVQNNVI
jgi:hypothetical protein